VDGQCLNERVVIAERGTRGLEERLQSAPALFASFAASMSGRAERHVLIALSQLTRRTVIVVGSRDDASMDVLDEAGVERTIRRNGGDPTIGRERGRGLALRARLTALCRVVQGRVQLTLGELCTFDPRRPCDFQLELHLLETIDPGLLVRHRLERQDRGLRLCEWTGDPLGTVPDPVLRPCVSDHKNAI